MAEVKRIHFLQTKCPGLPIYEMEGGHLMLPFYHKELKLYFWYSEKEMTANIPQANTEERMKAQQPFIEAKQAIITERQQKLIGTKSKVIDFGRQPTAEA